MQERNLAEPPIGEDALKYEKVLFELEYDIDYYTLFRFRRPIRPAEWLRHAQHAIRRDSDIFLKGSRDG